MSSAITTPDANVALDDAPPPSGSSRLRLHRMPLVWIVAAVPAAFLFYVFFLMPGL